MPELSSPGAATAQRVLAERRIEQAAQIAVHRYLTLVRRSAARAPAEFTRAEANRLWDSDVVPALTAAVRRTIPATALDATSVQTYLRALDARLRDHHLPDDVYVTARTTLTALTNQARPATLRRRQSVLRQALSLDTPTTIGTDITPERAPVTAGTTWRARVEELAQTEATLATSTARLAEIAAASRYSHKRWISHHDNRVRPTHLAANGQTVKVASPFHVGAALLMVPGDPSGPPEEVANCRCVLVAVATDQGATRTRAAR